MNRILTRWSLAGLGVLALLGALVLAVGVGFGGLSLADHGGAAVPASTPAPAPTASPLVALRPGTVPMPADADCNACHLASNGTVGVNAIPHLGHPLEGWENCTACHANDRLVQAAPGHTGIHANECLICHTPPASPDPAPDRPHLAIQSTGCLTCHGATAPLPADMAGRPETTCWLCHHATTTADLGVRTSR